jgi:hypothetical protein
MRFKLWPVFISHVTNVESNQFDDDPGLQLVYVSIDADVVKGVVLGVELYIGGHQRWI